MKQARFCTQVGSKMSSSASEASLSDRGRGLEAVGAPLPADEPPHVVADEDLFGLLL